MSEQLPETRPTPEQDAMAKLREQFEQLTERLPFDVEPALVYQLEDHS